MRVAVAWLAAVAAFGTASPCRLDVCSDDWRGVLGNEQLCWNPSEGATYYVIAAESWDGQTLSHVECASTNATCKDLPGTECYADALVVKACKPDPAGGPDLCSNYSSEEPVEVLPYACVRVLTCRYSDDDDARNDGCDTCEEPCWVGGPRRLLYLVECPP